MMPTSTFTPGPTLPGLRVPGGSGFDVIWCDASVMAYASRTGAPKRSSSWARVDGARAELHERMKRKPLWRGAPSASARLSSTWWIVGTAEYHVTRCAWAAGHEAPTLKREGTT